MSNEYLYALGYYDGRSYGDHSEWACENEFTRTHSYRQGYDSGVADYCLLDIEEEVDVDG